MERGADLVDVGAVGADGFVELLAGGVELGGPVGDVGGHFGVDLLGVMGALDVGALMTVEIRVDQVVVDGLGGGDDGVLGVGDALDRAVAVVVHVGHGVCLFLVLYRRMASGWG